MKRLMTALLLVLALPLAAQNAVKQEASPRFAFFTLGILVQKSAKAKKTFSELETLQKSLNDSLQAKAAEGQKIQQQLQGASLTDQGRDTLKKQLRDIEIDYKKMQEDSQEKFNKVQQKVLGEIFQVANPIIDQLAKEQKLQVVLSGESAQAGQLVQWADDKWIQEFTLEVARRMDAAPAAPALAPAKPLVPKATPLKPAVVPAPTNP
jgi:Skp family chaperone for outer membrane proteins